jgi:hypothetical protein
MNKISGWALAIYVLTITGVAAFEYAYIQHLEFIIRLLAGGNQN